MRKVSDLPQYLIVRTVAFPGRLPASGTRCPAHRRNPEASDGAAGAASPRGAWAVTGGRFPESWGAVDACPEVWASCWYLSGHNRSYNRRDMFCDRAVAVGSQTYF